MEDERAAANYLCFQHEGVNSHHLIEDKISNHTKIGSAYDGARPSNLCVPSSSSPSP